MFSFDLGELLDGRYRIEERIGDGGMADVYRAEDTALHRTVAIKLMRGHAETPGLAERIRSETTLLASMSHPALVTLFDAHLPEDGPNYLVMEYVDGPTLRDVIARGPMDAEEVAAMTAELAEALHSVHGAAIVHRDIKPSNVLLAAAQLPGRRYRPKLADFGIAYLLDSTRVTSPGMLIGTAAYLAPEQVRGQQPAPPADIYALGLLTLEALTGERAYPNAAAHETIALRLTVPPTIPESLGPQWSRLLSAMTATDPALRPTAIEVAVAASALLTPREMGATGLTAVLPIEEQPTALAALVVPPIPPLPVGQAATVPMGQVNDAPAAAAAAAASSAPVAPRKPRRVRRRLIVAALSGLALIAALAIAWAGLQAGPVADPSPSPTVSQSPSAVPTTEPAPSVVDTTPAGTTDDKGGGNGDDKGGGNDNSGPGNNNGGGKDKGKGNG